MATSVIRPTELKFFDDVFMGIHGMFEKWVWVYLTVEVCPWLLSLCTVMIIVGEYYRIEIQNIRH